MNIVEHVSLLQVGTSSGYMPRRGIAGSSSSTTSNFQRNNQTDFQSGYTSLQYVLIRVCSCPCWSFMFDVTLMFSSHFLNRVKISFNCQLYSRFIMFKFQLLVIFFQISLSLSSLSLSFFLIYNICTINIHNLFLCIYSL